MAFCTNCGKQVEDSDRFCAACGTPRRIEGGSAIAPAFPPAQAPATAEAPAWTQAAGRSPGYADWADTPPPPRRTAGPTWGAGRATAAGEALERVTTRAAWAVAGLVAWMIAAGFAIVGYVNEMTLVDALNSGGRVSLEEMETSDALVAAGAGLGALATVFAAVTFLMWLHLAWVNVERRRLEGSRWSASWAVGWWFIPVMNFFRPYQVMSLLWRASQSPEDGPGSTAWLARPGTAMLGWWWALYLSGGGIAALFGAVRGDESIDLETWFGADVLIILGLGLQIAAAVLAIQVVRRVSAMQERLRAGR